MLKYKDIDIRTLKSSTVNSETLGIIIDELIEHADDLLYVMAPFISTNNFNNTVPFNLIISYQTIFDTEVRNIRYFGYDHDRSLHNLILLIDEVSRKMKNCMILEGIYSFDFCRINVRECDLPTSHLYINLNNIRCIDSYNSTITTLHNNHVYKMDPSIMCCLIDVAYRNGWHNILK